MLSRILTIGFVLLSFTIGAFAAQSNSGENQSLIIGARFLDVDGNIRQLGEEGGFNGAVIVFVRQDCPVSSRYLPELNTFANRAKQLGINFYAVVSNPFQSWEDAKKLRGDNKLAFPVLFDPSGDLASRLVPTVTPEAFLVNGDDQLVYRGRIDNRFAGIGKLRQVTTSHDLLDAMDATVSGKALNATTTEAIGCFFEGWSKEEAPQVTFHKDIEPIIAANCQECHQSGGVAPFPLETFEDSKQRSWMLSLVVEDGNMPPWRATPKYGRFSGERYLSSKQKQLFSEWLGEKGNKADGGPEVKLPPAGWRMGEPDLELTMVEPFQVPATGKDVYRYFVIPTKMLKDKSLIGIDFLPGAPQVVHHANFFVDYDGKGRKLDAEDKEPGFSVFGTGGFMSYDDVDQNGYGIGGWSPGAEPYRLPDDTSIWLPKGGDLVVEIHYKLSGKAMEDRSKIGLYFADKPTKNYIDGLLIGSQDLDIKAGDKDYRRHISMEVPTGMHLVDIMPHMHYIGTSARVQLTYPDGTTRSLVGIEDWDLRWQNIYVFRKPTYLPKGSKLDAWFTYDNSAENFSNPYNPPKDLKWGWNSEDEMLEVWMGIIPDSWDDRYAYIKAANQSWYRTDSQPAPD